MLPVEHGIQLAVRYLESDIMRWQGIVLEKVRKPVVCGGESGLFIKVSFALEHLFAQVSHAFGS